MASSTLSRLMSGLTTAKGGALAGVAALGIASLLAIGGNSESITAGDAAKPAAPAISATGEFSKPQVQSIREVVRAYLLENPEILVEVSQALEAKQQAEKSVQQRKVIAENKDEIFHSKADFVLGGEKGGISVVEFFDYNCVWCHRAVADVVKVQQADPTVRFVMKEFPIFGEQSVLAAKAAMAAKLQGKYWEYHLALMSEKKVGADNIFVIAERVGLDVPKLKQDMQNPEFDKTLTRTRDLAQSLGIEGTPGFIIDNRVAAGYIPAAGMKQMIAEIRQNGCQVC